jgi:hypothetical protein
MDRDLEALPINVRDLEGEGFMEPEAQARDGSAGDVIVQGGRGREALPDFLHTQNGGETVCALRAHARQGVPVALADVLREEAETAVADTHGRGGEAIDVFPVPEGGLECLFRNEVGGFVVELSQQTDCTDRGFLRPFALATALESRKHLLTQWGHEMSPCMS